MEALEAVNMNHKGWRVKLYCLEGGQNWVDKGTGYTVLENSSITVLSEDSGATLIEDKLEDNRYHREGESILVWTQDDGTSLALSFADSIGAKNFYEQICFALNQEPENDLHFSDDEEASYPALSEATLSNWRTIICEALFTRRDMIARRIIDSDWLETLHQLYREAEASSSNLLPFYFYIYKGLVSLHNKELLEHLLSEQYYLDFFSALEHDPDLHGQQFRTKEFLTQTCTFKNVLDIQEESFLEKIHIVNRLQYLKDTVLARCLDETTQGSLAGHCALLWSEIVSSFCVNKEMLAKLKTQMEAGDFNSFCFLNELCTVSKNLGASQRCYFYETMMDKTVFESLSSALASNSNPALRVMIPEIVTGVLQVSPEIVKSFLLCDSERQKQYPFIKHVCSSILESADISVQQLMSELLRTLLIPSSEDSFYALCDIFYEQIVESFLEKFSIESVDLEETRLCLCEVLGIMTECITSHSYRMRYFIIYNDVVRKVLRLLRLKDTPLILAALKFVRALVASNDRFYHKSIVNNGCFKPVFTLFKENGDKENMVFHSVLAMLDAVVKGRSDLLMSHIAEEYGPMFKDSPLYKYFSSIISEVAEPTSSPNPLITSHEDVEDARRYIGTPMPACSAKRSEEVHAAKRPKA
jgi:protein phosphatase-4 regulatory subunit 3